MLQNAVQFKGVRHAEQSRRTQTERAAFRIRRDLDVIAPGFQLLAGSVGPSHAFVRVERFDVPVNVHGMEVSPGDLIHADRHGAVVIPLAVAEQLPSAIDLCGRREAPILNAARAPGFSVAKLRAAMGEAEDIH